MPTVPDFTPQVSMNVGNAPFMQASGIEPVHNEMAKYAAAQAQQTEAQGKAMTAMGNEVYRIGEMIQDKIDDAAATEAVNAFADAADKNDAEYTSLLGKGAVDGAGGARENLQKSWEQTSNGLQNDMQKLLFKTKSAALMRTATSSITRHSLKQLNAYEIGEMTAQTEVYARQAIKATVSGNPEDAAMYREATLASAKLLAEKKGLKEGSAMYDEFILSQKSEMSGSAIRQLVAEDRADEASKLLESAKKAGDFKEGDAEFAQLENLVHTSGVKDKSFRLMMTLTGSESAQVKQVDQMAVRGDISVDVRDATVQRIRTKFNEQEAATNRGNKYMMGQAQEWILKNPGKGVLDMPANLQSWAKGQGQLAALDSFAAREGKPANQREELTTRGRLLQQAAQDPEGFLAEYSRSGFVNEMALGAEGIRYMQNIAADMLRGTGKYSGGFDQKIMQDAIPKSLLANAKKDQRDAFVAIQHEEMDAWKKTHPGKFPTIEEQRQIAQRANAQWIDIGRMWNTEVPRYKVTADMKAVPQDFYTGMKNAGATEEEILAAWALKKGKK